MGCVTGRPAQWVAGMQSQAAAKNPAAIMLGIEVTKEKLQAWAQGNNVGCEQQCRLAFACSAV